MIEPPLRRGPWNLSDLASVPKNGFKVFSCFHCGGGSTMGYKLAGFDVLGGVEIDPKMMEIYRQNHTPKHSYLMGVQEFSSIDNDALPKELFSLDILDGSPPCSSFSMAGAREDKWGKKARFREGQSEQILDDLFFDFIAIAKKLRPKVVIAENVKGLISGKARGYVKMIFDSLRSAGYRPQLFLLNASRMGVPQRRERTFFIASRDDLNLETISLLFEEPVIPFAQVRRDDLGGPGLAPFEERLWKARRPGDRDLGEITQRLDNRAANWNHKLVHDEQVPKTITSSLRPLLYGAPRHLNDQELIRIQSFPDDFDFRGQDPGYVCGMSVPPYMMQRVSNEISKQWLKPLHSLTNRDGLSFTG